MAVAAACCVARPGSAAQLTARVRVESTTVHVGEPFRFQIEVGGSGSDNAGQPDMSVVSGFTVQPGGRSVQTTIINWRTSKTVIFNYTLTAQKPGVLTIPAITVKAGTLTARTRPMTIQVLDVSKSSSTDVGLDMKLSTEKCYVGQPVTLTVTWYVLKQVNGFNFSLPVLDDPRFKVKIPSPALTRANMREYVKLTAGRHEIIAHQGNGVFSGKQCLKIRFSVTLIPQRTGSILLPRATVFCGLVIGYRRSNRHADPFFDNDPFFNDFFGRRKKPILRKVSVASNQPALLVKPLPEAGRPGNFTGLVGRYSIIASARPTRVNVGDPITLTIQIAGPDYMDNVELPPLDRMPGFAGNFKIPSDMAAPKINGPVKTYTQTIRAISAMVKEIPPVVLPYFDAANGRYALAKSAPIPLRVTATRVVTARDAEGGSGPMRQARTRLQAVKQGIAYNYEGPAVLEDQDYGPGKWLATPALLALLFLPPGLYLVLLVTATMVRRRNADPAAVLARGAYSAFKRELARIRRTETQPDAGEVHDAVMQALRLYLGHRLGLPPAALTFNDAGERLEQAGVSSQVLARLRELMHACEASRYGGGAAAAAGVAGLVDQCLEIVESLERSLR